MEDKDDEEKYVEDKISKTRKMMAINQYSGKDSCFIVDHYFSFFYFFGLYNITSRHSVHITNRECAEINEWTFITSPVFNISFETGSILSS